MNKHRQTDMCIQTNTLIILYLIPLRVISLCFHLFYDLIFHKTFNFVFIDYYAFFLYYNFQNLISNLSLFFVSYRFGISYFWFIIAYLIKLFVPCSSIIKVAINMAHGQDTAASKETTASSNPLMYSIIVGILMKLFFPFHSC